MKNNFKRNNYIIIGLCSILLIMGIAYAAFASQLKISGTSTVTSSFIVKITSITPKNIVGTATDDTSVTTHTDTTATFGVNLVVPGDSITYDIKVENQGSVNAVLKTITKTDTDNSAIIFDTSGIYEGTELAAGESTTMTVTVTYNPEVTSQPENLTSKLTVTLDYVQKTGSSSVTTLSVDDLKGNVVTSDDGLYSDSTEEGRYVYKGSDPNNYIEIQETASSTALYRIISIESDGTLKIIRNDSIGNMVFDPGYYTSISGVTNSSSTTGTRYSSTSTDYCYYSSSTTTYYGCNVWGSKTTMLDSNGNNVTKMPRESGSTTTYDLPSTEAYINTYLNSTWYGTLSSDFISKITSHLFKVGHVVEGATLENMISEEKTYLWRGNVALMNITDYIKANSNTTSCGSQSLNNSNYSTCKTTNWLYNSDWQWALAPYSNSNSGNVWRVNSDGYVDYSNAYASLGARPVLYLSSNITFSGKGTSTSPYKIV